ncbi:MAG TPA: hypothetical protein VIT68_00815 [Candidatus Gracilibacteria bacterium]
MNALKDKLNKALLTPIRSIKARYIPLLLIYFAYGAQGITAVTMTFWEKENLLLSTEQFIIIGTWLTMPWTLKMIFGQLVDSQPIFGSRRKAYVYLGAILMALGYGVLYGLMIKAPWVMWMGSEFTVYLTSSLLSVFGFMIQDVTADTMTTEVVTREGRTEDQIKSEIYMVQILGRLSLMIAAVLASILTGKLAVMFEATPEKIIPIALGLPLISILGAAFIKLNVEEHPEHPKFNKVVMGGGLFYAGFILLMAFWDKLSGILGSENPVFNFILTYNQEFTFLVSLALITSLIHWLLREESAEKRRTIFFVFLAIFIFRMTPDTGPGFSWWAIDVLKFDREFFGVLKIIGATIPLVILWLFADYISQKPVRSILLFLILIGTILNLPELGLYYGIHQMIGLDSHFVAIVDTVWDSPMVHISMIPTLALIAYFAPAKSRGTWFAVGSSFMNLALTASALGTKYLNKIFVVSREIKDASGEVITAMDYSALGDLIIWKVAINLVIPLLAVWYFLSRKKVGKV